MELKCSKCGQDQSAVVSKGADGWCFTCAKCGSVEHMMGQPDGLVVMAFADDSDPQKDRERFVENIEGSVVRTWYTFDTVKAFMDAWREMVENPDGMWYWVLYNGKCICSGACDPYDEDIFNEEFDLDEDGNPVVGPHWKETRYGNWKKCSCCGAEVQQAEDYERSGIYQFCPRCGEKMMR